MAANVETKQEETKEYDQKLINPNPSPSKVTMSDIWSLAGYTSTWFI